MKYSHIECDKCGLKLNSLDDMVLYNNDKKGKVTELEFRHHIKCDDRKFKKSRHIRDGFDDLLTAQQIKFFKMLEISDSDISNFNNQFDTVKDKNGITKFISKK